MHPTTPTSFQVLVNGNIAQAVYDPQQAESFVLLSFCNINRLFHRLGVCNGAVAVEIRTREYFSCLMKFKILDRISDPYTVILGHDWFNMCSTGLEDKIDAVVHLSLSSPSQWLVLSSSPFNAICTQLPSSDFCDKNNHYIASDSYIHDIFHDSDFWHAISSAASCSSTGTDSSGPGANTSLKSCKNNLDSEICPSSVDSERDSLTMQNTDAHFRKNNIDCTSSSVYLIEEILTSVENMSKPTLTSLAVSHGINITARLTSDNLKYILLSHLCKGCCLYSTFEGCIQVMSTLDDTVLSESKHDNNSLLIFILTYLQSKVKL